MSRTRPCGRGRRTAGGEIQRYHRDDFVIAATGVLHHPHTPDVPGSAISRGRSCTPRWHDAIETAGKWVAVIGSGSTGGPGSISLQYSAELTARYITCWLRRYRDGEFDTVEVAEDATTRFTDAVADAMGPTAWNTGCQSCTSPTSGPSTCGRSTGGR